MNQRKLVWLMMKHILVVKIQERELFQIRLKDRAYEIARNRKHDGYQRALASMVYKIFDKKTGQGMCVNEQISIIKKFKRRHVYARFKDNIWAENLAEMESLSSKNKNVKYLLCHRHFYQICIG